MTACVFCEIIKGNLPCHKVYEDEQVLAILDHRPVHLGHTLILPKKHVDYFMNLDDDLAAHIVTIGNKLARKMMANLEPKPLTVGHVIHGFVPHVHYHVIPQYTWDDITTAEAAKIVDGKVVFDANQIKIADAQRQEEMARILTLA